ncbi:hypothetical protein HLV39_12295 [Marinobacter adhaerens]|uniref:Uncharacterized protein n=1 Tax=Marinobacter adhaerens TaxID=1033846 RepID=A0A851I2A1_9GAMM|nr:hypothetical protein [Marinobacter adhaerens]NWN92271.1 hypothetical protein [Marinobacter adhaerens]
MPEKFEISLPWPPNSLNPNTRGHWAKKAQAAEMYRYTCRIKAKNAIREGRWDLQALRDQVDAGGQIHVFLDFYPPNRRRRDDDNVVAAFKSGRDGLADALGIDDCHFRTHPFLKRDEVVKPLGEVRVVITGKGPEA